MSEVVISVLILAAEVAAALAAIALVTVAVILIRRRRKRVQAQSFVTRVEHRGQDRRNRLRAECAGFVPEERERRVKAVQNQERRVYARILELFRGAGQAALAGIENEIDRLVTVSQDLRPPPTPEANPLDAPWVKQRIGSLEERLRVSEGENKRLLGELVTTREALRQLQAEYAAIYERERRRSAAG